MTVFKEYANGKISEMIGANFACSLGPLESDQRTKLHICDAQDEYDVVICPPGGWLIIIA